MRRRILALAVTLGTARLLASSTAALAAGSVADGEAPSLESTRETIVALVAVLGDGQGPATLRACKTNSMGECVYRERARRQPARPPRSPAPDQEALIAAYEAFLADPVGAAAPEADAYRYHLARLLDEAGDLRRARPHLERVAAGSDADPRTLWAAALLIDGLVREWTDGESDRDARRGAAQELRALLERLQTRAFWRSPAAQELRAAAPLLDAGLRWTQAVDHMERGREATDPDASAAAFTACAREFQAIFADHRNHDRADTLLWNAGRCLDAAHEVDAAIAQWVALVDAFPQGEHVRDATLWIADLHHSLGRYEEAATWCERFASRFPKESDTVTCLDRALQVRLGLGPRDRLAATYAAYEDLYATKNPTVAARIRWTAYPSLAADDRARRAFLEAHLGDRGWQSHDPILRRLGEIELARVLSRGTCPPGARLGGLCIKIEEVPRARRRRWVVARRSGVDHERALRLARPPRGPGQSWLRRREREDDPLQMIELNEASAAAALMEADAGFEALVSGRAQPRAIDELRLTREDFLEPPRVDPPKRAPASLAAIAGIAGPRADAIDGLDRAYAAIVELTPGSVAAVHARARRGLLRDWLTDEVASSPAAIERSPVGALQAEALEAYRRCLDPTAAALAAEESVDHCERRMAALAPGDPGILREFFGPIDAAGYGHPVGRPDIVGVIVDADEALAIGARLTSASP